MPRSTNRQATCEDAATAIGLGVEVEEFWYFPPTRRPDLVAAVRDAAAAQGFASGDHQRRRPDAVYMARVASISHRDRGRQARRSYRLHQRKKLTEISRSQPAL